MINQLTKYNNEELRKIQQYIPFEVFTIKDGEKPRVKLTVKTLSPEQKEKGYISITDQFEYTKSLGENELKMRVLRRTDMYGLGISLSTALDDKYARNRHIRKFEGLIARLMSQDLTDDDITLDECIDRYDAIVDSLSGRANVREPITT
jgi:hypothetical protein